MAKINQNFSNFFSKAAAAGYGSNQIIQFLQGLYQNPIAKAEKGRLHEGAEKGTLRPDEQESLQEITRSEMPERIAKGAANLALSLGGAGVAATQGPALLQKAAGVIGALGGGGASPQQGQAQPQAPGPAPAQAAASQPQQTPQPAAQPSTQAGGMGAVLQKFISQYPDIGKALDKKLTSGKSIREAALEVKNSKLYKSLTKKIEDDMGQPFEDLLEQLFGSSAGQSAPKQSSGNTALVNALDRAAKALGG